MIMREHFVQCIVFSQTYSQDHNGMNVCKVLFHHLELTINSVLLCTLLSSRTRAS